MEQARSRRSEWTPYLILAVSLATVGGLLFGHDTGVISGALLYLKKTFNLGSALQEGVTATVLVGAVCGAAAGGKLSDVFGRRRTIIAFGVIFCIGSGGTALAIDVPWLFVCRFIVGFAIGGASLVAPLYISEISPRRIRGGLVFLNQVAITLGILLAYLLDYGFANVSSEWGWRLMFAVGVIPGAILFIGMMLLPDSPRFLIGHGRKDEARAVIERVRGTSGAAADEDIGQVGTKVQAQGSYRDLLRPNVRIALVVGVGLAIFQQITGINTIIYYAPTILQQVGVTGSGNQAAILGGAAIAAVNLLATIAVVPLVDRIGRRVLLIGGMVVMSLSLAAVAAALLLPGVLQNQPWIVIALLMTYVVGFAVGLGPVFWLMISEIYPLQVRGIAMSIATIANWAANLLVALTFLTLFDVIGRPATFILYAALCVAAIVFAFLLVPETKGRSLEDIEDMWRQRAGMRSKGRGLHSRAGRRGPGAHARACGGVRPAGPRR